MYIIEWCLRYRHSEQCDEDYDIYVNEEVPYFLRPFIKGDGYECSNDCKVGQIRETGRLFIEDRFEAREKYKELKRVFSEKYTTQIYLEYIRQSENKTYVFRA